MESIKIRTHIGDDGILQIQLPAEIANQELDVVIVFQPVSKNSSQSATKTPEELGYPRRFFEEVIGSWEGEPLERPEQLPFEKREEIKFANLLHQLPETDDMIPQSEHPLAKFAGILSDSEAGELLQVIAAEFEQVGLQQTHPSKSTG